MEPRGAADLAARGNSAGILATPTKLNKMAADKEVQQLLMVANFLHENAEVTLV